MDTTFIQINKNNNDVARKEARGLELLREGASTVTQVRATIATMMTGDGSEEGHFQMAVDRLVYPSLADAKAAWDDLEELSDIGLAVIQKIHASCARRGL